MGNIWCEELWILFKTKEAAVCFDSFCNKYADEIEGFKCEGIIETYSGFLKTASAEPLFQLFDAGWHVHRLMSGFYEHHPSIDFLVRYVSEGGLYLKFEAVNGKMLVYDAKSQWWKLDFACDECGWIEKHMAIRNPEYAGGEFCCPGCGYKSVFEMSYELEEYEFIDDKMYIRELSRKEYEEKRKEYNLIEVYQLFEKTIDYLKIEGIMTRCWKNQEVREIQNRRWFICRKEDKTEITSIKNVDDFTGIVVNLKKYVEKNYIDLADEEDLTKAIQAALPEDMNWSAELCIDIFIKAADKFIRTYRKSDFYINAGDEAKEAFTWIIENIQIIKDYQDIRGYFTTHQNESNAIIECDDRIRPLVRRDLYRMLLDAVQFTHNPEYDSKEIHILKIDGKICVFYPVGEVYGQSYEYIESVKNSFQELKKKYDSIGIRGLVYYNETVSFGTTGIYFWSERGENGLHSTYEWQKCKQCGKVYTEDVFYNSSEWDNEEGTMGCLCSPACALEYALGTEWRGWDFEIFPNKNILKKYPDLYETMDWHECSRDIIWNELLERFDECVDDFSEKKERLKIYAGSCDINPDRWKEFIRKARDFGIDLLG